MGRKGRFRRLSRRLASVGPGRDMEGKLMRGLVRGRRRALRALEARNKAGLS
jgi:hypothetical protein